MTWSDFYLICFFVGFGLSTLALLAGSVHLHLPHLHVHHGIHIPHNRIYRVLLNHGLVEINMKKRQQRKYVRYVRAHSMSMWQGDWKEFEIDNSKKWMVVFIDDSSRLITCYGVFESPKIQTTITVLNQGFREYGTPREILTDHGVLSSFQPGTGNMPNIRSRIFSTSMRSSTSLLG